jgi:hypothetical protein
MIWLGLFVLTALTIAIGSAVGKNSAHRSTTPPLMAIYRLTEVVIILQWTVALGIIAYLTH